MYDEAVREYVSIPSTAFGAASGTATRKHIGPKGKKGLVRDIYLDITVAMVGTTTVPEIDVGTASGDYSYARFRLGSAAGTGYGTGSKRASQVAGFKGNGQNLTYEDFTGHVKMATDYIPADTEFVITAAEGVGGSPAGTAVTTVVIDWI